MKKHTTRALAMLLTLAMMLGMVPTAFAETIAPPAKEGTSDVTPPPAQDGAGDATAPPAQDGTGNVTPPPTEDGTVAPTPLPADAMTLEGIVFDDRDGDGMYDPAQGDAPYASYAVDLLAQSGANPHKVLQSTTTDADGKYSFASLPAAPMEGDAPAAYFVAAQLPHSDGERVAAQRTPYSAETFAADSDGVPGADALENASLAAADMAADPAHDSTYNLHLNLGFALPIAAKADTLDYARSVRRVKGIIFEDKNNNGMYEPAQGETPYPNVEVHLGKELRREGNTGINENITSIRSNANGEYSFENLQYPPYNVSDPSYVVNRYYITVANPRIDYEDVPTSMDSRTVTKTVPYSLATYKNDNDGTSLKTGTWPSVTLDMNANPSLAGDYFDYINVGFAHPNRINIANSDAAHGTIRSGASTNQWTTFAWPDFTTREPQKEAAAGYRFSHWTIDYHNDNVGELPFEFSTPIGSDVTIKAYWKPLEFDVTLHTGASDAVFPGSNPAVPLVPGKLTVGTPLSGALNLPGYKEPTRPYHTFAGWYLDAETRTPVGDTLAGIADKNHLYAKWQAVPREVRFKLAGGNINGSNNDVVWSDVGHGSTLAAYAQAHGKQLPAPRLANYHFAYWIDGKGNKVLPADIGQLAVTENITYTAEWTPIGGFSGTVYTDSDYDGQMKIVGGIDNPVVGLTINAYYKNQYGETQFASTTTDSEGKYRFNLVDVTDFFVAVQETTPGFGREIMSKRNAGSAGYDTIITGIYGDAPCSDKVTLTPAGLSGQNIGYRQMRTVGLFKTAACGIYDRLPTNSKIEINVNETKSIYYKINPAGAAGVPNVVLDSAYAEYIDISVTPGVINITGKKEMPRGPYASLQTSIDTGVSFIGPRIENTYIMINPLPVVAEFPGAGYFYTDTEYKKADLTQVFSFRNTSADVTVAQGAFQPTHVYRIDETGKETEDLTMLTPDKQIFDDAAIGRYRMVFGGKDSLGRPIVDINGNPEISRLFYIHGAPYLKQKDPLHARVGSYSPGHEADGTTIIATHKHVDEKTGAVTENEEFKASDGLVSLLKFVPYTTDGTNVELPAKATTLIPTKPGKYEVYYYVRMLTANLPVHRTLYLHGNPALQVPTVIHMPPKGTPSSDPIDIDYAAEIVWRDEQLVMKNLEHVNEDGTIRIYNRDNTQFFKSNGVMINGPIYGFNINAGPVRQPAGGSPEMNIYIKDDGKTILNTPGVYPVTMIFEDTLDKMGTAGTPGSWDANKQYVYDKAKGIGYLEMKVNVIITGTDNLPSLPSADALAYQFVVGDDTAFQKLTSTPDQADIDSGKVVALSRDTDENGAPVTDYYGADAAGNIDLKTMLTRVLLSHTHDLDYETTVSTPGLSADTKRLLRTTTLSMMENNTSLSRMKVTVGGATGDTTIDDPTNAQLLAQTTKKPGTADITFTVPDVRIVLKASESHTAKPGEIVSAGDYWVILDKTKSASETYKFYTHSDLKFRRKGVKNETVPPRYGLHVPSEELHPSMEFEAYFIGGKLLKEQVVDISVAAQDISTPGTKIEMNYTAEHMVAPQNSTLPTLRAGEKTYKATAFVNDWAQVHMPAGMSDTIYTYCGAVVDMKAGCSATVSKFTNIVADGAPGDAYPSGTYTQDAQAKLAVLDETGRDLGTRLNTDIPGEVKTMYTAMDMRDANNAEEYHNGVNQTAQAVKYVIDGTPTVSFGAEVARNRGTYEMTVWNDATDAEIDEKAQAAASIVFGDNPYLAASPLSHEYAVTRDGSGYPVTLTITATNPRVTASTTQKVVNLKAIARPVIKIIAVDEANTPIAGASFPDITNVQMGQPYTVFAPYVAGYLLTGAATQTIAAVQSGVNEVKFIYRRPAPAEIPVQYTVTYTAGVKTVETMRRTGIVGRDVTEVAPDVFIKGDKRYTRAADQPESITKKLTQDPAQNIMSFNYTEQTISADKVAYAMQYTYAGQVVRSESFVGNVGDTVTKTAPSTFVEGQYRYTIIPADAAAKTLALTANEATNVLQYAYTRADLPTGGGGGGGGGGSTVVNYALTFEVGGGTAITAVTATSGEVVSLSEYKPTRVGYVFTGWFEDSACKTPITEVKLTKNTMVYAGWKSGASESDLLKREHFVYMRGYQGAFAPDSDMTRAEAAVMFYRLLKSTDVPITKHFTDVTAAEGAWYIREVETLASLGILTGYPDGRFRPDGAITRAEFATLVSRFAGLEKAKISFTDVGAEHWAYRGIATAVAQGWVSGYPDGSFRPEQNISRAEAVKIVNAVLGRVPYRAAIDKQTTPFGDVSRDFWAYYEIMEAAAPCSHPAA